MIIVNEANIFDKRQLWGCTTAKINNLLVCDQYSFMNGTEFAIDSSKEDNDEESS